MLHYKMVFIFKENHEFPHKLATETALNTLPHHSVTM